MRVYGDLDGNRALRLQSADRITAHCTRSVLQRWKLCWFRRIICFILYIYVENMRGNLNYKLNI